MGRHKKLESKEQVTDKATEYYSYLAGLIDGDGCFTLTKNWGEKVRFHWDMRLQIASVNKKFLEGLKEKINLGTIQVYRKPQGNRRSLYAWVFSHNAMCELIPKILCYLKLKRERAKILLIALNLVKEHGHGSKRFNDDKIEILYKKLKELNKRGLRND